MDVLCMLFVCVCVARGSGPAALARAAIISHLTKQKLAPIDVAPAAHVWDPAWARYKRLHLPSMVLTVDSVFTPTSEVFCSR
jgi:hypothetical protein